MTLLTLYGHLTMFSQRHDSELILSTDNIAFCNSWLMGWCPSFTLYQAVTEHHFKIFLRKDQLAGYRWIIFGIGSCLIYRWICKYFESKFSRQELRASIRERRFSQAKHRKGGRLKNDECMTKEFKETDSQTCAENIRKLPSELSTSSLSESKLCSVEQLLLSEDDIEKKNSSLSTLQHVQPDLSTCTHCSCEDEHSYNQPFREAHTPCPGCNQMSAIRRRCASDGGFRIKRPQKLVLSKRHLADDHSHQDSHNQRTTAASSTSTQNRPEDDDRLTKNSRNREETLDDSKLHRDSCHRSSHVLGRVQLESSIGRLHNRPRRVSEPVGGYHELSCDCRVRISTSLEFYQSIRHCMCHLIEDCSVTEAELDVIIMSCSRRDSEDSTSSYDQPQVSKLTDIIRDTSEMHDQMNKLSADLNKLAFHHKMSLYPSRTLEEAAEHDKKLQNAVDIIQKHKNSPLQNNNTIESSEQCSRPGYLPLSFSAMTLIPSRLPSMRAVGTLPAILSTSNEELQQVPEVRASSVERADLCSMCATPCSTNIPAHSDTGRPLALKSANANCQLLHCEPNILMDEETCNNSTVGFTLWSPPDEEDIAATDDSVTSSDELSSESPFLSCTNGNSPVGRLSPNVDQHEAVSPNVNQHEAVLCNSCQQRSLTHLKSSCTIQSADVLKLDQMSDSFQKMLGDLPLRDYSHIQLLSATRSADTVTLSDTVLPDLLIAGLLSVVLHQPKIIDSFRRLCTQSPSSLPATCLKQLCCEKEPENILKSALEYLESQLNTSSNESHDQPGEVGRDWPRLLIAVRLLVSLRLTQMPGSDSLLVLLLHPENWELMLSLIADLFEISLNIATRKSHRRRQIELKLTLDTSLQSTSTEWTVATLTQGRHLSVCLVVLNDELVAVLSKHPP